MSEKQINFILYAMTDLAMNVVKEELLLVEETDDSCVFKYFEVVPLDTDTDVSSTTECASGDGSSEVKQENLTSVKQEPDDVCWLCYSTHIFILSQQKQFLHILINVCFYKLSLLSCSNCSKLLMLVWLYTCVPSVL